MSSEIRALVVDDDATSRLLVCAILEKLSVERVASVSSGRLALEALERDPAINFLICDLRMPEIDGVALMAALPENRNLAILIISGLDNTTLEIALHASRARGLEIVGAIEKPVRRETLEPFIISHRQKKLANATGDPVPGGREGMLKWLEAGNSSCEPKPIIDLHDGSLSGISIAPIWGNAVQSISSIGIEAKRFGLMRELALATLAQGGRFHLSRNDSADHHWMSFLLDASVLTDRQFPDLAKKCIQSHWLEPEQIVFEVKHADVVSQPAAALEVIARMRIMGFQIALDAENLRFKMALSEIDIPFQQLRLKPSYLLAATEKVGQGAASPIHELVDAAHARSALAMAVDVDSARHLQELTAQHMDLAAGSAVDEKLPEFLRNGSKSTPPRLDSI